MTFLWWTAWLVAAAVTPVQPVQEEPEYVSPAGKKYYGSPDARGVIAQGQARVAEAPDNIELLVELGLTYGSLKQYRQAIETYSRGLEQKPDWAPLYRHRGHRYITVREFAKAQADLEKASQLDPKSFDISYHLALTYYLTQDFAAAVTAYQKSLDLATNDDDRIAASYWLYLSLRHLDRDDEAQAVLEPIRPAMRVERMAAYFKLLAFYKGRLEENLLMDPETASPLELATYGHGLASHYLFNGKERRARELFQKIVEGPYWPAFGYIAAEAELNSDE
jgi:tetratricopeptide (TPR) repeat protein